MRGEGVEGEGGITKSLRVGRFGTVGLIWTERGGTGLTTVGGRGEPEIREHIFTDPSRHTRGTVESHPCLHDRDEGERGTTQTGRSPVQNRFQGRVDRN